MIPFIVGDFQLNRLTFSKFSYPGGKQRGNSDNQVPLNRLDVMGS